MGHWRTAANAVRFRMAERVIIPLVISDPISFCPNSLAEWQATQPSSYQYWFERREFALGPADLRGLVTVSNGAKEVSSVSSSGEPTDEFNPEDFLTPEELFDRLAMLESSGIRLAHVIHDKTWGFPAKVLEISGFDPIVEYHIIDFVDTSDHSAPEQGESSGTAKVE